MKLTWHLAFTAAASLCAGIAMAQTPKPGGELRVGIARDVVNMAPWLAHGASVYVIQQNVYDNLITYDDGGKLGPQLAVSWKAVDPTTYVLELRQGVVFHDGDTFDAEDAKASLDRMRDPTGKSALAPQLADISAINVLSPHTIELKLSKPNVVVLSALASSTAHILSKEWLDTNPDLNVQMNGTGPFMFDTHEPGVSVSLKKNPNYWRKGMPYLDRLVTVPYRDDSARVNALRSGEVDFIEYVPYIDFGPLRDDLNYTLVDGVGPFNIVALNVNEKPFNDVRVRQALNYLIDRDALIDLVGGGEGNPMKVALLQPSDPYYGADLETWKFDPEKALSLIREAGYKEFSDISFVLTCSTVTVHKDTAEAIQALLQGFGMKVEIRYIDVPTLLEYRQKGGYVALMDGYSMPYDDPDAYSRYFETGSIGYAAGAGFSDPKLDALLVQGRSELDPAKRKEVYHAYEAGVVAQAPWFFGFFRAQAEAMASKVKGYKRWPGNLGGQSTSRMEEVWIEN